MGLWRSLNRLQRSDLAPDFGWPLPPDRCHTMAAAGPAPTWHKEVGTVRTEPLGNRANKGGGKRRGFAACGVGAQPSTGPSSLGGQGPDGLTGRAPEG